MNTGLLKKTSAILLVIALIVSTIAFSLSAMADEPENEGYDTGIEDTEPGSEEPEDEMPYVFYKGSGGYVEVDGERYPEYTMYCEAGSSFVPLNAVMDDERFYFGGWYTGLEGRGERYTEDTIIDRPDTIAYAFWVYDDSKLQYAEPDTEYDVELYGDGEIFIFIPEETAMYEIYTYDIVRITGSNPYITLLDQDQLDIAGSHSYDLDGNQALSYEFQAGQKYYIHIREGLGAAVGCTFKIQKPGVYTVTFHANRDDTKDAYFDGDPAVTEKEIRIAEDTEISSYRESGLETADPDTLEFRGWSLDKDATDPDEYIYVDKDMDVYGVYREYSTLILDANGGYFPTRDGATETPYYYLPETDVFYPFDQPVSPDENKKFAGWATSPDAEEPDIFEGFTKTGELGDRIYAVYTETVKVTYIGNGGYFLNNPDVTTYETTEAKGHYFSGMRVFTDENIMEHVGWIDQNGVAIISSDEDLDYRITEDSVFIAQFGRRIVLDGNGGYFDEDPEFTSLRLMFFLAEPYSMAYIEVNGCQPEIDDTTKYLAGWGTEPDLEEPDLIDGESHLDGIDRIYAIWKDIEEESETPSEPDEPETPTQPDKPTEPDESETPTQPDKQTDPYRPDSRSDDKDQGGSSGGRGDDNNSDSRGGQGGDSGRQFSGDREGSPRTGDSSNLLIWAFIMILSMTGISALTLLYLKAGKR